MNWGEAFKFGNRILDLFTKPRKTTKDFRDEAKTLVEKYSADDSVEFINLRLRQRSRRK